MTRSRAGLRGCQLRDGEGRQPGHPWVQGERNASEAQTVLRHREGVWGDWGWAGAFPNIHAKDPKA